jgi:hypothetical protein
VEVSCHFWGLQKLENVKMIRIAFNIESVSFFGKFLLCDDKKKLKKNSKSCHILREKESHFHPI